MAWQFLPIVRRYSREGQLISELKIDYKIMQEESKSNYNSGKTKKERGLRLIILNIVSKEDGFYTLRYYPRIEILEFNNVGKLENIYWTDQPYNYIGSGFVVKENKNSKTFFILQNYPNNEVTVFSYKHERR